jgi:hypothetical protein
VHIYLAASDTNVDTPSGQTIHEMVTLSFVKVTGPQLAIRFTMGEHMKRTDDDGMGHVMRRPHRRWDNGAVPGYLRHEKHAGTSSDARNGHSVNLPTVPAWQAP